MTNAKRRDFRAPEPQLDGKSILVTGGTGSFGRRFVRTVLDRYKPERLIVFSRDELKQFEMQHEPGFEGHPALRFFLGDVRDDGRLEMALRDVDIVVHAAALKQITAAEYNPFECIRTNVHGAENLVRAALRAGVRQVVALSTDKAANPINLYGASKLASDKIFIAGNNLAGVAPTRFGVVRYGNVIGSRGSVVPFFRKLLADGVTALPVTDERMTRFWITLQQGVDLVLSTLVLMRGGEIFVPKIPSMRVIDLAALMSPGTAPRFIGIRPGEKVHEALIAEEEARNTYDLGDRYVIAPSFRFWSADGLDPRARPIGDESFSYMSNNNSEWLSKGELEALLAETP
ncbi:MAG: UDP-N-acetylglucosamine 4,6-dehydratase (inverting) [Alphaproteobacteria bacterium]|nr:UDP-N-acetylglucosamine 4,6-dehydratase (inverting) [Alphaproteobacteria bacterium]